MADDMPIKALAPWFGANRVRAEEPGRMMGPMKQVVILFAGGLCELPHFDTRCGIAIDQHRHIINLARVVRDAALCDQLAARLEATLFHPDELADAQRRLADIEMAHGSLFDCGRSATDTDVAVQWAADYFVACWMGRGGNAGVKGELGQALATRFGTAGGDSCKRFRSATESLSAWSRATRHWTFEVRDAFDLLPRLPDEHGTGVYADPPWYHEGDRYKHRFTKTDHKRLRAELGRFDRRRVIVRYGDCEEIRSLYAGWQFREVATRDQCRGDVREVLVTKPEGGAA